MSRTISKISLILQNFKSIAADVGGAFSRICLFVRTLKG